MDEMKRSGSIAVRWMTLQVISFVFVFVFVGTLQYKAIKRDAYREVELTGRLAGQIFREMVAENERMFSRDISSLLLFRLAKKISNIGEMSIVDSSGRIIACSDMNEIGTLVNNQGIIKLLNEYGESFQYVERAGHKRINVAMSLEGFFDTTRKSNIVGVISFDLDLEQADRRIFRIFSSSMLMTLLFLTALWTGGYFIMTRVFVERIRNIMDAAYRLGRGEYSTRVSQAGSDELAGLASTFNRMAEALQKARAEIETANTELKDFAYVVSHDLKAPLRAISTLSNWLVADYADKLDEQGQEFLNLLVQRSKRMNNLISGILEYSRVGRVKEEMKLVELETVVRDVIDLVVPPEHVVVTIETKLPAIVGEPTRIYQVFQNLIGNAVKHMDKPNGEIRVGFRDEGRFYTFSVADNGPGIEEKYFNKIFEMFQTLKSRDEVENTGAGLTIVKKIVEMYGGRIWVESKIGSGSTFWFTLPSAAHEMTNKSGKHSQVAA